MTGVSFSRLWGGDQICGSRVVGASTGAGGGQWWYWDVWNFYFYFM